MRPKKNLLAMDLFRARLKNVINLKHPICILADSIDWKIFEEEFGRIYVENKGRPGKPIRLLVGLHYLKYMYGQSDELVVEGFLENPYWQYFCGCEYFMHELPIDPTTMVKWRKRIGPKKMEKLLEQTIDTAKRIGSMRKTSLRHVNVDTTVQEKAIAFPTDARLMNKMRVSLVKEAKKRGMVLRQSYERVGQKTFHMHNRYSHARQKKRANRMLRKLRTYLGRVVRDVESKAKEIDPELENLLNMAKRIMEQKKKSKNKVYSIHVPEVACISKGKAHKKYEFGNKVGVVSTSRDNWIVGVKSFEGNPYDGHSLKASLEQMVELTGDVPEVAYVDRGYRGHGLKEGMRVHIAGSGSKKATRTEKRRRRRRSVIEPIISYMKHTNRLNRNFLKGIVGDQINAVLAGCGFNMRKLLRVFYAYLFYAPILAFRSIFWVSRGKITAYLKVESLK